MSSVSVFCCLKGCLDNFTFHPTVPHVPRDNPIQLDTAFMGYEVVVVKGGLRLCGSGAVLGNAPLVQSKSYFEVKVQQNGTWAVGLATRQTDVSLTQVDDGAILDIILDNFNHPPPSGFEKIMLEQSLL
uniref:SPRY domain-containing protein 7 n=1 Tax=Diabrotica virgifera virgifera TaxID=50390 RepID=A0A6P7FUL4_DIAVI